MLEAARGDAAGLDELVHVVLFEPDDPTEAIADELPLVDEPVEGAGVIPRCLAASAVLSQEIWLDMGQS